MNRIEEKNKGNSYFLQILRVNTKYNTLWVRGVSIPGLTNSYCYIYDTLLPRRKHKTAPYFPTYLPSIQEETLSEELFADDLHPFAAPTIEYKEES